MFLLLFLLLLFLLFLLLRLRIGMQLLAHCGVANRDQIERCAHIVHAHVGVSPRIKGEIVCGGNQCAEHRDGGGGERARRRPALEQENFEEQHEESGEVPQGGKHRHVFAGQRPDA